jgi:hypothetical protein
VFGSKVSGGREMVSDRLDAHQRMLMMLGSMWSFGALHRLHIADEDLKNTCSKHAQLTREDQYLRILCISNVFSLHISFTAVLILA